MFKPGTHVSVCISSKAKGTGPRKGSLGFVCDVMPPGFTFDNYAFTIISVFFYRFGFEQKTRTETKMLLFPVPCNRTAGTMKDQLHELKKKIRTPRLEQWRVSAQRNCSTRTSAMALLKPENNLDLVLAPAEVFAAWANCMLDSYEFRQGLTKVSATSHILRAGALDADMLTYLNQMAFVQDYRAENLVQTIGSAASRLVLIDAIKLVTIVHGQSIDMGKIRRAIHSMRDDIPMDAIGHDRFSVTTNTLSPFLFTGTALDAIKSGYKPKTSSQMACLDALEQIKRFRDEVLVLF